MEVVKTQMYLKPEQHRALKSEARRLGISISELLRRAVQEHLDATSRTSFTKSDFLGILDLGRSGQKDGSEHHDKVLDEAWRSGALR